MIKNKRYYVDGNKRCAVLRSAEKLQDFFGFLVVAVHFITMKFRSVVAKNR